jgi:hypothetical protein
MKRSLVFLKLFFFSAFLSAQILEISPDKWNSITDTSAFDGISRAAFIVGTSDDPSIPTPVISLNKTDGEDIVVILAYVPGIVYNTSMLYVKFDNGHTYTMNANYTIRSNSKRYIVRFNPNSSDMNIRIFMDKLKNSRKLYMRLSSPYIMIDLEFKLDGAEEALKVLEK